MNRVNLYYHGRVFDTIVMNDDGAANMYMEANPGWGVLWVDDDSGRVYLAAMDDNGRKYVEGEVVLRAKILGPKFAA